MFAAPRLLSTVMTNGAQSEHNATVTESTRARSRPIGVFDSGVGGLTVLRALKERLPRESTVYLGDTARVPYGARSAGTVVKYAINAARTLLAHSDIKLLVVACNTATAHALPALIEALPIPIVGVVEPGARAARNVTRGGSVVVLGTHGTVRSGAYVRALAALGVKRVVSRACPLFVPLVEEGWTSGEVPLGVARAYLKDLPADTDTVVLGCTHYPLLTDVLRTVLDPRVSIVNGAVATADDTAAVLHARDLASTLPARHQLLVTDGPEQLVAVAPLFLGAAVALDDVELIDVMMTA